MAHQTLWVITAYSCLIFQRTKACISQLRLLRKPRRIQKEILSEDSQERGREQLSLTLWEKKKPWAVKKQREEYTSETSDGRVSRGKEPILVLPL